MTTQNSPVIPATLGRIVMYTLNQADVDAIRENRATLASRQYNDVAPGQMFAAQVVRTFGDASRPSHAPDVNLVVQLDGADTFWATSRTEGAGPGHWHWPSRVQ